MGGIGRHDVKDTTNKKKEDKHSIAVVDKPSQCTGM